MVYVWLFYDNVINIRLSIDALSDLVDCRRSDPGSTATTSKCVREKRWEMAVAGDGQSFHTNSWWSKVHLCQQLHITMYFGLTVFGSSSSELTKILALCASSIYMPWTMTLGVSCPLRSPPAQGAGYQENSVQFLDFVFSISSANQYFEYFKLR